MTDKPTKKAAARALPKEREPVHARASSAAPTEGQMAGLLAWHRAQTNIEALDIDLARDDLQPRVREYLEGRRVAHLADQVDAWPQILGK